MIHAELNHIKDDRIAVIKDGNDVILTISLNQNPQVFNLLSILDQANVIDLSLDDPICHKNKLKQVRESKGLTLEQLADLVGCTRQNIAKIENGTSEPKLSLAIKISDVLGIDIRELI